jgi:hypothetical protein
MSPLRLRFPGSENSHGNSPITIAYGSEGKVTITDTATQATHSYYYDDTGSFIEYQKKKGRKGTFYTLPVKNKKILFYFNMIRFC